MDLFGDLLVTCIWLYLCYLDMKLDRIETKLDKLLAAVSSSSSPSKGVE